MASRRKTSDEGVINLDSLMDALTNVVAVLILILILLQVDVTNTIERLLGELKPATPEQIEAAKLERDAILEEIARQQRLLNLPAPTADEIRKIEQEIASIESTLKTNEAKILELRKIQELAQKTKADADAEKKKTDTLNLEIVRFTGLLEQTPKPKAVAPTVVKVPNSRDIPENANIYYCYIHGDQAHLVDLIDVQERVMAVFDRHKRDIPSQRQKQHRRPALIVYDHLKAAEVFSREKMTVRNQTITVSKNPGYAHLRFTVTFDPKKGDASLADMMQPKGRFHNMCNLLSSYPRRVLIFRVHPNGFATYLKAREIADAYRIPCGWEIGAGTSVNQQIAGLFVTRLGPPPKPSGPSGPRPPTLKRQLD